MTVFSDGGRLHLHHLRGFLERIRECNLTLNLRKCSFAKGEVKFCGQLIGSGKRRADPDKIAAVRNLKVPETKTQVRQILGFFSFFRDYITEFAEHAKPLTDLTTKRVPSKIPWGAQQQIAFDKLKQLLINAVEKPLQIINPAKPYHIHVDASDYAVGAVLGQPGDQGSEQPFAFASKKLNVTQRNWATVEKGNIRHIVVITEIPSLAIWGGHSRLFRPQSGHLSDRSSIKKCKVSEMGVSHPRIQC